MSNNQNKIEWLKSEWLKRPKELRNNETHILLFQQEIKKSNPALLNLKGVKGDVYQFLKTILKINS